MLCGNRQPVNQHEPVDQESHVIRHPQKWSQFCNNLVPVHECIRCILFDVLRITHNNSQYLVSVLVAVYSLLPMLLPDALIPLLKPNPHWLHIKDICMVNTSSVPKTMKKRKLLTLDRTCKVILDNCAQEYENHDFFVVFSNDFVCWFAVDYWIWIWSLPNSYCHEILSISSSMSACRGALCESLMLELGKISFIRS